MRRVFPAIVILITVSVLGILFTQVQWIRNARLVKHEQYMRSVTSALSSARTGIQDRFLEDLNYIDYMASESMKQEVLAKGFTAQALSGEAIADIIRRSLANNGIKEHFDFAVLNVYGFAIVATSGFDTTMLAESRSIRLTPDISTQGSPGEAEEVLYLHIKEPSALTGSMLWMVIASILLTAIVIAAFTLTVHTIFSQRKLAQIKSDFINNMTHEFKTPLATISLAADALSNKKVICNEDQIRYYSNMIKEENKRMNKQVETILQAARLEKNEVQLALQPLDAHAIIHKVADTLALRINEKSGTLKLYLNATNATVMADEVHFSNIVYNLLDNAIKYSLENLELEVSTATTGRMLAIKVKDNGIGMTRETASRIFEKFYRAHTGNLHNVKGFGLGLSYVKATVDAHGGKIRVDSMPGKGSTFTVSFPLAEKEQA
jgi:two-component system phosphate regulon sensor histidine kinase PhoR